MNQVLIERYIKGELSGAEREDVEEWINAQGKEWLERFIDEHWERPEFFMSNSERIAMKDRVLATIRDRASTEKVLRKITRPGLKIGLRIGWAAAACLVLLIGIGLLRPARRTGNPASQGSAMIFRNDSVGKIKVVHLPDGSLVSLNVFSSLELLPDYNGHSREVLLKGEAFFEVPHDVHRPFIVHTPVGATRVYGTAFNVSAYPRSSELRIGLQSGKIGVSYKSVKGGQEEKVLSPGQLLIYEKGNANIRMSDQAIGDIGAWRNGGLVFYKTPLKDVLEQLENKYGVKFSYPADLNNQTITASFEGNSPMDKVLADLSFAWNIHFQQEKDSIYVK